MPSGPMKEKFVSAWSVGATKAVSPSQSLLQLKQQEKKERKKLNRELWQTQLLYGTKKMMFVWRN